MHIFTINQHNATFIEYKIKKGGRIVGPVASLKVEAFYQRQLVCDLSLLSALPRGHYNEQY